MNRQAITDKVLFLRVGALGDIIHCLPLARTLINAGLKIYWPMKQQYQPLISKLVPEIKIFPLTRGDFTNLFFTTQRLLSQEPDLNWSIDLQGLIKTAITPWILDIKNRAGFSFGYTREPVNFFYTNPITPRRPEKTGSVIFKALEMLKPLGLSGTPVELNGNIQNFLNQLNQNQTREFLEKCRITKPVVLINIGHTWSTKKYPADFFRRLTDKLIENQIDIRILWGPGEKEFALRSASAGNGGKKLLLPPTDQIEMTIAILNSRLLISGDTSALHLASYFKIPTISLFGPTSACRNGAIGPNHVSISSNCLKNPCFKRKCSENCLEIINPDIIYQEIINFCKGGDTV